MSIFAEASLVQPLQDQEGMDYLPGDQGQTNNSNRLDAIKLALDATNAMLLMQSVFIYHGKKDKKKGWWVFREGRIYSDW